jgi:hypothetical protein
LIDRQLIDRFLPSNKAAAEFPSFKKLRTRFSRDVNRPGAQL